MKKGFTLIELLVVVLIIGILAAVALPQYTKTVEKSKSAEALVTLKSVYQAAQEFQMANGNWPSSLGDLSVTPSWTGTTKWYTHSDVAGVASNENWSLQINHATDETRLGVTVGRLTGKYEGGGFALWHKYSTSSNMPVNTIVCAEKMATITTPGEWCQKIMQCKGNPLVTGGTLRYYKMP